MDVIAATKCPKQCKCCIGDLQNGGKPPNSKGYCEHFCSDPLIAGGRFCGEGKYYKTGYHYLDCRKCRSKFTPSI